MKNRGEKMEKGFNFIELTEKDGKGKIKIDEIEIKGIEGYEIKRDTDIAKIKITINVPSKNFNTSVIP